MKEEHWTNGGTAITNFSEHMRPVYVEALKRWAPGNLVIRKCFGGVGENYGGSLHYADRPEFHDISDFWVIYEEVKKEMKLSELMHTPSTPGA